MLGENELLVKITADITSLQNGLNQAASKISGFGKSITAAGKGATIVGGAIVTAAVGTFKTFADYEEKLTDMAKVTDQSFGDIETAIKGVDPILGNMTELMGGYYQVISAGVTDPVDAINLLTEASQLAKSGHLEQADAVKALTKMMAGYGGELETTSQAADLLYGIEQQGQTSVAELVPLIGGLATQSHNLGITGNEMGGALSLITRTAGSTAEATTMLQGIMTAMMKPTTNLSEAFNSIGEEIRGVGEGYKNAEEMIADLGFVDSMKKLQEYSDQTGISLGDLFGRKEAMIGFMALADDSFKTLDGTIEGVASNVGAAKTAFNEWSETGKAAMDEMKSSFSNLSIIVGEAFAPMVTLIIGKITELIPKITEWVESHKPLVEAVGKIGLVLAVGGPVLIGLGFLVTAISAILSPVGLVIAAVIGLAAAWATNFGGIRDITKSVVDTIKTFFSGLIDFIKNTIGKILDFVDSVATKAKKIIADLKKAVTTGITVGPETEEGFGIGGTSVPSHAAGISYVPQTGLALLHKGEAVIPASQNQAGSKSYSPTIYITVEGDGDESKIRRVIEQALEDNSREFYRSGNLLIPGMA